MTYKSNTTKDGFVTKIGVSKFTLFTGRKWVDIDADPNQIQQISALPDNTRIMCKIQQLKTTKPRKVVVLGNRLISFTVKSGKTLSEAFMELKNMIDPYIDDIQNNIDDKD